MYTQELARVVVSDTAGAIPEFCAAFAIARAPPVTGLAPAKPTTVIDATFDRFSTPVTVIDVRAVGATAHQISASPRCTFDRAARVQVSSVPLLFIEFTWVFVVPVDGPSAEMKETSSVFPATANAGLTMFVFGVERFFVTDVAIVGAGCPTVCVRRADVLPANIVAPL